MNILVSAQEKDIEICSAILESAKAFQREQGFVQWTDDYPNIDVIRDDVKNSKGYVVKSGEKIAGYMCIDFDGEPAYDKIEGNWNTTEPYAVVHRMAFSPEFRGIGLADITFKLIEELCVDRGVMSIRIDTDFPNKRMQHILEKNGFVNCGVIVFQGSGKLAYDKTL
ncbi:MAG: GNAT family N-acetyltransferase [Candidatus Heteroscillospira sp.]